MQDSNIYFEGYSLAELLQLNRISPDFERINIAKNFRWDAPVVRVLLQDLTNVISSGFQPHFLGSAMLAVSDGETAVVKGQQRLLAGVILARALYQALLDIAQALYAKDLTIDTSRLKYVPPQKLGLTKAEDIDLLTNLRDLVPSLVDRIQFSSAEQAKVFAQLESIGAKVRSQGQDASRVRLGLDAQLTEAEGGVPNLVSAYVQAYDYFQRYAEYSKNRFIERLQERGTYDESKVTLQTAYIAVKVFLNYYKALNHLIVNTTILTGEHHYRILNDINLKGKRESAFEGLMAIVLNGMSAFTQAEISKVITKVENLVVGLDQERKTTSPNSVRNEVSHFLQIAVDTFLKSHGVYEKLGTMLFDDKLKAVLQLVRLELLKHLPQLIRKYQIPVAKSDHPISDDGFVLSLSQSSDGDKRLYGAQGQFSPGVTLAPGLTSAQTPQASAASASAQAKSPSANNLNQSYPLLVTKPLELKYFLLSEVNVDPEVFGTILANAITPDGSALSAINFETEMYLLWVMAVPVAQAYNLWKFVEKHIELNTPFYQQQPQLVEALAKFKSLNITHAREYGLFLIQQVLQQKINALEFAQSVDLVTTYVLRDAVVRKQADCRHVFHYLLSWHIYRPLAIEFFLVEVVADVNNLPDDFSYLTALLTTNFTTNYVFNFITNFLPYRQEVAALQTKITAAMSGVISGFKAELEPRVHQELVEATLELAEQISQDITLYDYDALHNIDASKLTPAYFLTVAEQMLDNFALTPNDNYRIDFFGRDILCVSDNLQDVHLKPVAEMIATKEAYMEQLVHSRFANGPDASHAFLMRYQEKLMQKQQAQLEQAGKQQKEAQAVAAQQAQALATAKTNKLAADLTTAGIFTERTQKVTSAAKSAHSHNLSAIMRRLIGDSQEQAQQAALQMAAQQQELDRAKHAQATANLEDLTQAAGSKSANATDSLDTATTSAANIFPSPDADLALAVSGANQLTLDQAGNWVGKQVEKVDLSAMASLASETVAHGLEDFDDYSHNLGTKALLADDNLKQTLNSSLNLHAKPGLVAYSDDQAAQVLAQSTGETVVKSAPVANVEQQHYQALEAEADISFKQPASIEEKIGDIADFADEKLASKLEGGKSEPSEPLAEKIADDLALTTPLLEQTAEQTTEQSTEQEALTLELAKEQTREQAPAAETASTAQALLKGLPADVTANLSNLEDNLEARLAKREQALLQQQAAEAAQADSSTEATKAADTATELDAASLSKGVAKAKAGTELDLAAEVVPESEALVDPESTEESEDDDYFIYQDDDGNFWDEEGRRCDEHGQLLDDQGRVIDEDGNFLDEEGNALDEAGNIILTWEEVQERTAQVRAERRAARLTAELTGEDGSDATADQEGSESLASLELSTKPEPSVNPEPSVTPEASATQSSVTESTVTDCTLGQTEPLAQAQRQQEALDALISDALEVDVEAAVAKKPTAKAEPVLSFTIDPTKAKPLSLPQVKVETPDEPTDQAQKANQLLKQAGSLMDQHFQRQTVTSMLAEEGGLAPQPGVKQRTSEVKSLAELAQQAQDKLEQTSASASSTKAGAAQASAEADADDYLNQVEVSELFPQKQEAKPLADDLEAYLQQVKQAQTNASQEQQDEAEKAGQASTKPSPNFAEAELDARIAKAASLANQELGLAKAKPADRSINVRSNVPVTKLSPAESLSLSQLDETSPSLTQEVEKAQAVEKDQAVEEGQAAEHAKGVKAEQTSQNLATKDQTTQNQKFNQQESNQQASRQQVTADLAGKFGAASSLSMGTDVPAAKPAAAKADAVKDAQAALKAARAAAAERAKAQHERLEREYAEREEADRLARQAQEKLAQQAREAEERAAKEQADKVRQIPEQAAVFPSATTKVVSAPKSLAASPEELERQAHLAQAQRLAEYEAKREQERLQALEQIDEDTEYDVTEDAHASARFERQLLKHQLNSRFHGRKRTKTGVVGLSEFNTAVLDVKPAVAKPQASVHNPLAAKVQLSLDGLSDFDLTPDFTAVQKAETKPRLDTSVFTKKPDFGRFTASGDELNPNLGTNNPNVGFGVSAGVEALNSLDSSFSPTGLGQVEIGKHQAQVAPVGASVDPFAPALATDAKPTTVPEPVKVSVAQAMKVVADEWTVGDLVFKYGQVAGLWVPAPQLAYAHCYSDATQHVLNKHSLVARLILTAISQYLVKHALDETGIAIYDDRLDVYYIDALTFSINLTEKLPRVVFNLGEFQELEQFAGDLEPVANVKVAGFDQGIYVNDSSRIYVLFMAICTLYGAKDPEVPTALVEQLKQLKNK